MIEVVSPHCHNQEYNQSRSNISSIELNVKVNYDDNFNMNLTTDQEAYTILMENFDIRSNDIYTG